MNSLKNTGSQRTLSMITSSNSINLTRKIKIKRALESHLKPLKDKSNNNS